MPGSPVKRIIGTFLFTIALVAFLAFIFLLFADAENITDIPGTDQLREIGLVTAILLGVIALLLVLLLIVKRIDTRARRAAEAEAYYIPEDDREGLLAKKRELFDRAFLEGPGPAPSPPDVKVYYLPGVPLADRGALWGDPERHGIQTTWPVHFPRTVESGVYANDYIQIDRKGNRLKLRTLLAGIEDFPEEGPATPPPAPPTEAEEPEEEPEELETPAATRPPRPEPREPEPREPERREPRLHQAPASGSVGGRSELASDRFMQELESRYAKAGATAEPETGPDIHYDYPGDVHFIEDIEGIGPHYGARLRDLGIHTTARLCYEDPVDLSYRLDLPTKTVRGWQTMAELIKVSGIGPQYAEALARAGVDGIADLKKRSAKAIAEQVNGYLAGLQTSVLGQKVTEKRVKGWQDAAASMRRVRMKIPVD